MQLLTYYAVRSSWNQTKPMSGESNVAVVEDLRPANSQVQVTHRKHDGFLPRGKGLLETLQT